MKSIIYVVVVIQLMFVVSTFAQDFDFFYFVLQWPGAYCDSVESRACCYERDPTTGKPKQDFRIVGLWPSFKDGTYLSNCNPNTPFDQTKITNILPSLKANWPSLECPENDGISLLAEAWEKHGKCSQSVFDQQSYFLASLDLKDKLDVFKALTSFGFQTQDLETYFPDMITDAIKQGVGHTPHIDCNFDGVRNQLYQVFFCVNKSGTNVIDCPVNPQGTGSCGTAVEWPDFW